MKRFSYIINSIKENRGRHPVALVLLGCVLSTLIISATLTMQDKKEMYAICSPQMSRDAICGLKDMECAVGRPGDTPPDDESAYRWTCVGLYNGRSKQCREAKAIEMPTTKLPQTCHATFMGWWDWCAVLPVARYILSVLLAVFSSVAVLMLIYGGVLYITSSGDPQKTDRAKKVIMYTLLGVLVVAATWGLISLTASLIGAG